MKFKLTPLKSVLALIGGITAGIYTGFYFQSGCFDCPSSELWNQFTIGFVPPFLSVFLLVYGIWSIFQKSEQPRKIWIQVVGVLLVIILAALVPLLIGVLLSTFFKAF